jgi:hypothetical protein
MKGHLSSEQIDRLMAGDAAAIEEQHAAECADCGAELARARQTLSAFTYAVRRCAEQHGGAEVPSGVLVQARQRDVTVRRLGWAIGTAVVVVLAAIPLFKGIVDRQRELQAQQDSLLLEQVNAHVSRVVPASMESFMELLAVPDETETGGRE